MTTCHTLQDNAFYFHWHPDKGNIIKNLHFMLISSPGGHVYILYRGKPKRDNIFWGEGLNSKNTTKCAIFLLFLLFHRSVWGR